MSDISSARKWDRPKLIQNLVSGATGLLVAVDLLNLRVPLYFFGQATDREEEVFHSVARLVRHSMLRRRSGAQPPTARAVPRLLNNPAHWHLRAQEAKLLASVLEDPVAKGATLKIAEEYERLAARAVQREHDEQAGKPYPSQGE